MKKTRLFLGIFLFLIAVMFIFEIALFSSSRATINSSLGGGTERSLVSTLLPLSIPIFNVILFIVLGSLILFSQKNIKIFLRVILGIYLFNSVIMLFGVVMLSFAALGAGFLKFGFSLIVPKFIFLLISFILAFFAFKKEEGLSE